MGHAVEAQVADELVPGPSGLHLGLVHAAVVELAVPHGELEFQVREAGFLHFLPEPGQGILRSLHASDSLDEGAHLVNHEHRLAVNLVVIGLLEKQFYVPLADFLELPAVHSPAVNDVPLLVPGNAGIPVVPYIVVGPHEVELHLVPVAGFQEALRESGFHPGAAVQPVPVEDEDIHPVRGGLVNLHLHHGRIGLVDIAPEGMAVPGVAGEAFLHGENGFPFSHSHGPEGSQARIPRRIGGIKISRNIILLGLEGKGAQKQKKSEE